MSRRKHAWVQYHDVATSPEMDADILYTAQRSVESAVIEDFTDRVLHDIQELSHVAEECQSRHVRFGIQLAIREILRATEDFTS